MKGPGVLTISLDFELHWGSRDHRSLESHRDRVLGGRAAVGRILELFARHGIHATWAAVGLMFFDDREELLSGLPARKPAYANPSLSPYAALERELGRDEREDPYHYAPSLIRMIRQSPGQELATHTFSHYYCLEPGQTAQDFSEDLRAAREVARRKLGVELGSLVFPRSQFNEDYVELCAREGLKTYRGNPRSWIYEPRSRAAESLLHRGMRLVDSYVNLTGHHGYARGRHRGEPARERRGSGEIVDVPASRFLRPYSKRLAPLEGLRLKRITGDLSYCAKQGLLYHLWWHPDNFGTQQEENLAFLDQVLAHYGRLRDDGRMKSLNMAEAGLWMSDAG